MPDYRRYRVPGGTSFFTINLLERRAELVGTAYRTIERGSKVQRADRPLHIDACVVLPDHCDYPTSGLGDARWDLAK
jgi:REP-associated tyrosine transposase